MALEDDIREAVTRKFAEPWSTREGRTVPDETSVQLGNDGIYIDATILYADLADSTVLVDTYPQEFSAEIYGTFLNSASRIIRAHAGNITAFDGDRVMAVYMGDARESRAVRTAFRIQKAVTEIIRPALKAQYPSVTYVPAHTVGIDSSRILVVKDGIRGANDLIWVGKAANHAAKLCALSHNFATRITKAVYDRLEVNLYRTNEGADVWEPVTWTDMNNAQIYRSNCVTVGFG
ncbi:class 3 adenylate cyclase [Caulobacter sp. BE264]|uniref:adenylate/guanylate cyclase domain-containing protein n=1 Tax=Caulobacter sp. BE264 TaxID=2817724 RepID=UPI002858B642|nr:adenylate/guanylate cyclase domain-containing protein [Caulobacter sp. BE264]MDR7230652.1 class 3 adenylate cyclase [Caulobacter sp. BE264]